MQKSDMTLQAIWEAMLNDIHLQDLKMYAIGGWPSYRADIIQDIQTNWPFRDELVMINVIAMEGRRIRIT